MKQTHATKQNCFTIKDDFWDSFRSLVREEVLPYQHAILEDQIPDAEKSHAIENFRIAAGISSGEFYGMVFQDSDVAKWIEACAYSLAGHSDQKLENLVDEVIELIGKAQQEDGYLNTYFTLKEPGKRWTNLLEGHELYCAGHMMEAAVAYYEATGKDRLLQIMIRMADHIYSWFGKDKTRGIPGHPEVELALLKLYRTTGSKKYLELCKYFIDERGTEPNYFAEERSKRDWSVWNSDGLDRVYNQSHMPVREQKDAVGHSVRAVYLYTAMADLAGETDDIELRKACETLWNSIVHRRMYITGGIGSTVLGEAFTEDYDLPNDTVYAETCASIGLIFFAQKLMELSMRGEYADVLERALYNTVLAGMSRDGHHFFYVNPLEVTPGISGVAQTHRHVLPERPKWFGCACCPPNVARLLMSLEHYVWSESEDTIYSNLYIGGEADFNATKGCRIITSTNYPEEGEVSYTVATGGELRQLTIAVRIPAWSELSRTKLTLNGEELLLSGVIKDGYAYITRKFADGDELRLNLCMEPFRVYADTRLRSNEGCVALQRGPFVYCLEGVDHDGEVHSLRLPRDSRLVLNSRTDIFDGIPVINADGIRVRSDGKLYSQVPPRHEAVALTAIPYYLWGNRGLNQMRVWIQETMF